MFTKHSENDPKQYLIDSTKLFDCCYQIGILDRFSQKMYFNFQFSINQNFVGSKKFGYINTNKSSFQIDIKLMEYKNEIRNIEKKLKI